MGDTGIPYIDRTVNAIIGCPDTGQSCLERCWARELHTMRHKAALSGKRVPWQYALPFSLLQIIEKRIEEPLHWRKPCTILWNSMGDTFHEQVPFEVIDRMMAVVALTPQHKHLFLTKKVERETEYFEELYMCRRSLGVIARRPVPVPLPNLYLGLTCMTQADVDRMLRTHLSIAGKHWISVEPLLSEISLLSELLEYVKLVPTDNPRERIVEPSVKLVVVGCEKYKGKPGRFCEDEAHWWDAARSIKNQCQEADVDFWMKAGPVNGKVVTALKDMPEDMRIRESLK